MVGEGREEKKSSMCAERVTCPTIKVSTHLLIIIDYCTTHIRNVMKMVSFGSQTLSLLIDMLLIACRNSAGEIFTYGLQRAAYYYTFYYLTSPTSENRKRALRCRERRGHRVVPITLLLEDSLNNA